MKMEPARTTESGVCLLELVLTYEVPAPTHVFELFKESWTCEIRQGRHHY